MSRLRTETRAAMCSHKRRFAHRGAALLAIKNIRRYGEDRGKWPTRAYRCPGCKGWHLTSEAR